MASGYLERQRATASLLMTMEIFMMDTGRMGNRMVMGYMCIKMEGSMKAIGRGIKNISQEEKLGETAHFMKDSMKED
eukprot:CAMPEP_0201281874 /NCGR_PEP_ID=MMETSP1317-20130820/4286_1 /ASSEMBLY_ACC=CAM_ASM_000770 /TAXON_ID=187299 /ORGANISM="Undescribed Undescribed, Strain Undescribed" /LENGTH=76 /DNA_ID=CAMNT_0047593005 /DNA_START=382 /DNA_END=612 /DNA_ORIENTATION=+